MSTRKDFPIAASLLVVMALSSSPAHADQQDCEILLCLANPSDAKQIAECIGPMKMLKAMLSKFKPRFPVCDEAKPNADMAFQRDIVYPDCPAGQGVIAKGVKTIQMKPEDFMTLTSNSAANIGDEYWTFGVNSETPIKVSKELPVSTGIGEGDITTDGKQKVCASGMLGVATIPTWGDPSGLGYHQITGFENVTAYQVISFIDQDPSAWIATVTINGQEFRKAKVP